MSSSSFTTNSRFRADAEAMRDMLRTRVYAAREYVCQQLGFNGWSRHLDDHGEVYAFVLPQEIYDDEVLVETYKYYIMNVFAAHFLSAEEISIMRDTSPSEIIRAMGEEAYDPERYHVDWCGSRSREVELGPHIYFRIGFNGGFSERVLPDPVVPEDIRNIRWNVVTEEHDQHYMKQWAELPAHL